MHVPRRLEASTENSAISEQGGIRSFFACLLFCTKYIYVTLLVMCLCM